MDEVAVKYDAWKDILQNTNTSKNAAFPAQTQGDEKRLMLFSEHTWLTICIVSHAHFPPTRPDTGLKKELEQLVRDVGGLAGTVQAVEANRSKFTHISETELDSRRRFVQLTRDVSRATQIKMDASCCPSRVSHVCGLALFDVEPEQHAGDCY